MLVLFWLCPVLPQTCLQVACALKECLGPRRRWHILHSPPKPLFLHLLEAPGVFGSISWQSSDPAQGCRGALTVPVRSCGLATEPSSTSSPIKPPFPVARRGSGHRLPGSQLPGKPEGRPCRLQELCQPPTNPSFTPLGAQQHGTGIACA